MIIADPGESAAHRGEIESGAADLRGVRKQGLQTCARTIGTLASFILPDASEYSVYRPTGANVAEQVRVVAITAANGAHALVMECMALQPLLQWLCESRFIQATHGVITNARQDYFVIMGPPEEGVALAVQNFEPDGQNGRYSSVILNEILRFTRARTRSPEAAFFLNFLFFPLWLLIKKLIESRK